MPPNIIIFLVRCPLLLINYIFSCTRDGQNVFEGRFGEMRGGNFEPKDCLFYESWCLVVLRGNSSNRKGCMQTTWQLCVKRKPIIRWQSLHVITLGFLLPII
jgi:hypothetical protein